MTDLELKAVISVEMDKYMSDLKKARGEAEGFGSKVASGFKTLAKVGAQALTAATGAATAFTASAVKAGMSFDASMSQVAATMGKTVAEMEQDVGTVDLAWGTFSGNLREFAQEMGKNTVFSATQAADALNYMALAGYNTQESMEALPNVLNLAAAGNFDLARASDMVTDTQTAFGISAERTARMVDEMAKAASTVGRRVPCRWWFGAGTERRHGDSFGRNTRRSGRYSRIGDCPDRHGKRRHKRVRSRHAHEEYASETQLAHKRRCSADGSARCERF